ncbi:unnamed protein product [Adineta steineri]|uniref:Ubiquitin-like domain-containing protein n=1 Tax=Adineta steineri TaxID=433720 RepID=A0A820FNZ3_9BILA|nr:unnamed protein product [Adineta steineri]
MSFINLYFVTICGRRTVATLPEDFELTDIFEVIQNKLNCKDAENCILFCKGRRLSLNNSTILQIRKRKLINNGDVIFVCDKITNCDWNRTVIKQNEKTQSSQIVFL